MKASRIDRIVVWLLFTSAAGCTFGAGLVVQHDPLPGAFMLWFGLVAMFALTGRSVRLQEENEQLHDMLLPEERIPTIPSGPPTTMAATITVPAPPRLPSFED